MILISIFCILVCSFLFSSLNSFNSRLRAWRSLISWDRFQSLPTFWEHVFNCFFLFLPRVFFLIYIMTVLWTLFTSELSLFSLVFHLITPRDDYYGDDAGINNLFYTGHYFANVQVPLRDETGKTNVSSLEFVIWGGGGGGEMRWSTQFQASQSRKGFLF